MEIGEVAATTARDGDFASDAGVVFKDGHAASALTGSECCEESGCAASENDDIKRGH